MATYLDCPIAELTHGIVIANFASPHSFTFDDGTVLAACDPSRVRRLTLEKHEIKTQGIGSSQDIEIHWRLTKSIIGELNLLCNAQEIHLIIVAHPMMTAIKSSHHSMLFLNKVRCILTQDKRDKILYSDRFCI